MSKNQFLSRKSFFSTVVIIVLLILVIFLHNIYTQKRDENNIVKNKLNTLVSVLNYIGEDYFETVEIDKLLEIDRLIVEINKRTSVKSKHLVDLLQYHSLLEELTKANG